MTRLEHEDRAAREFYARRRRAETDEAFAQLEQALPEYGAERRRMRDWAVEQIGGNDEQKYNIVHPQSCKHG